ncbi:MAG: RNA-binding transcriptional accessory protein, partial [Bacteroidota bacterium]|nr:RNA-binding transcriptional accessory protein [Bacteroidota bacterium]MDX5431022.1 RNA-binding transcriptional accessory protein [Bacteroidota bacterium]MDX5469773.1 RNA-binding transcriptional accessory protein [Bacteroidota bacterium]
SRYRKEATGSLDEVQIASIEENWKRILELEKRREAILKSIEEQGKLTDKLKESIEAASSMNELEDLYLPYKQKRKTRATTARERGLEPLAKLLMTQRDNDPEYAARRFISKEVPTAEEALAGARDIIAEWVSEHAAARGSLRNLYEKTAMLETKLVKGKEQEGQNYRDYFNFSEPLKRSAAHRILAIDRAESEGILRVSVEVDKEKALERLDRFFVRGDNASTDQVEMAVEDSFKRLIGPSMETEFRRAARERAETESIAVFGENVRQLLLEAPLGKKRILAIDPGFRTGCKVVCLDESGHFLTHQTIYPHEPQRQWNDSISVLKKLQEKYGAEAIAVGNGTAGRETEQLVKEAFKENNTLQVYMVNEAGASIYSASEIARHEFPDLDVTVRGSISIGRRLLDPLAELVKIDPKSIGVGQYQHDLNQERLKEVLERVVVSAVNQVGVNLNTASPWLLRYLSGIGPGLSEKIVEHRSKNGPFKAKKELLNVSGLGPKAYQQAAGFVRIPDAVNPLDASAVHPESYPVVEAMAKSLGKKVPELIGSEEWKKQIRLEDFVKGEIGLPTLQDILSELSKPGRDPRGEAQAFSFDDRIRTMDDLQVGMRLPGIVMNMAKFGAFVDIGLKENGLLHISQITDRFIKDPAEVLQLNQKVQVRVTEIDKVRKRIGLSMKE